MFSKTLTASALALSIAFGASTAFAQSYDAASVKVRLAGLNASSEAGAKIILRRIHNAAVTVCGPEPSAKLDRLTKFDPCVKEVTNRTVMSLNAPMVTALNSGAPVGSAVVASTR